MATSGRVVVVALVQHDADLRADPDSVLARGAAGFPPPDVRDFASLTEWLDSEFIIPEGSTFYISGKPFDAMPYMWLPFKGTFPDGPLFVKVVLPSHNPVPLTRILEKLDFLGREISVTRSASQMNADDLEQLRVALKVLGPISEDKDGNALKDENVLERLLGDEEFWDQKYEEQQRDKYCKVVEAWTRSDKFNRSIRWVNGNQETVRRRFEELHFTVSAKNDLVAVLQIFGELFAQGAVLGVELKRKSLTKRSLRQAQVEFLLWADASCVPFVQLITDMQKGGVAFYCKRMDVKSGIELRQVVLASMDEVRGFVSSLGGALPDDLGEDGPDGLILHEALERPPRKKFRRMEKSEQDGGGLPSTGGERPTKAQIALWTIGPRFLENDGDVANLADLDAFEIEAC